MPHICGSHNLTRNTKTHTLPNSKQLTINWMHSVCECVCSINIIYMAVRANLQTGLGGHSNTTYKPPTQSMYIWRVLVIFAEYAIARNLNNLLDTIAWVVWRLCVRLCVCVLVENTTSTYKGAAGLSAVDKVVRALKYTVVNALDALISAYG